MREIKFRGKRVDNGRWVYGGFFETQEGPYIVCDFNSFFPIIKKTAGQYTGFKKTASDGFLGKACEGQEIYEGDIFRQEIECDEGDRINYLVVMWISQRGAFYLVDVCHYRNILDNSNNPAFESDKCYSWLFDEAYLSDFSIDIGLPYMGNIFDNPELLEK